MLAENLENWAQLAEVTGLVLEDVVKLRIEGKR